MALLLYDDANIQDIADAIRAKTGSLSTYTVGQMAQAIMNIPSGGGGVSTPLWSTAEIVAGEYVSNTNGTFISDGSGARSPMVAVTENAITVFTASDWNNIYNAWYDSTQTFISSFSLGRGGTSIGYLEVVNRPANARYVCISNSSAAMPNIRAWDGNIM